MARSLVLDTHALLWFVQGDDRLGTAAKAAISDPNTVLIVPIIALAEAVWIIERGRTNIQNPTMLFNALDADHRYRLVALDRAIIEKTISLNALSEMHDRQIVATVLAIADAEPSVVLVSMDRQIAESKLVTMLW